MNERQIDFGSPLSQRGWPKWLVYTFSLFGLVYLLNPTWGLLELIPDNLPLIGNIDEGAAAIAVWYGLAEFLQGRKQKREK